MNEIEAGAFSGLMNLHRLNLRNNDLKEIRADTWMGLPSLKELFLGSNKIENLPSEAFMGLTKVVFMHLANNDLNQIRGDMFEGLFALEDLYLHGHDISLEPGAFVKLPYLNWLNLETNKLETLKMRAFLDPTYPDKHPPKIFVPLGANPLTCDEKLCWLKEAKKNQNRLSREFKS